MATADAMRACKESRLLNELMKFANLEWRWSFGKTNFLKQHLAYSAMPFMEAGGVANDFQNNTSINNNIYAEGLGVRVAWNVSTILRFDYSKQIRASHYSFISNKHYNIVENNATIL